MAGLSSKIDLLRENEGIKMAENPSPNIIRFKPNGFRIVMTWQTLSLTSNWLLKLFIFHPRFDTLGQQTEPQIKTYFFF